MQALIFRTLAALGLLASTMGLSGCAPPAPPDDAGPHSFAQQAVIHLLGRRPKGVEEVNLLADLSAAVGRQWVVRALMERPEFEEQWTHHLMDYLKVQRGGRRDQPSACFGAPLRVNDDGRPLNDHGVIARVIRDNPPNVPVPGTTAISTANAELFTDLPLNANDAVRSAIRSDDLSPILSVFVFPFAKRGVTSLDGETGRLAQTDIFTETFLNRNFQCSTCHNSLASTSNKPGWQRTWPIPILTENEVFSGFPGDTARLAASPTFRQDIALAPGESASEFLRPWGLSANCGVYRTTLSGQPAIVPELDGDEIAPSFAGSTGSRISVGDLVARYRSGYQKLRQDGIDLAGPQANGFYTAPSDESLAYMVASTLSTFVWETVMGEKLTIANYYARTEDQMMMQWHLTHYFVTHGFSLKDLLEHILLGGYFGRRPPLNSQQDVPYHLPLILDPWIQSAPCPAEEDLPANASMAAYGEACRNGQGAIVHRWSSRTLLSSVGYALGWPQPRLYPSGSDYPNTDLARATGQYFNDLDAGSASLVFQGLLGYESVVGACEKQSTSSDWIDILTAAALDQDANGATPAIALLDVIIAVKDRLVQYPAIGSYPKPDGDDPPNAYLPGNAGKAVEGAGEGQALAALFGAPLSTPAAAVPELEAKLRQYCGVLLKSPQFMLAGVTPPLPGSRPSLRVCLPGETCTYLEMCHGYRNTLAGMGKYVRCQNGGVGPDDEPLPFETDFQAELCPLGTCTYLPSQGLRDCLANPAQCRVTELPPPCDPRRGDNESCGERPEGALAPGAFVALLDGATVTRADGIGVLPPRGSIYRDLRVGERLALGSVLRLRPASRLEAVGGAIRVRTPASGMPSPTEVAQRRIDRLLLVAAADGRPIELEALLAGGANIDSRDRTGETALMKSVKRRDLESVRLLLDAGADWSITDFGGSTLADLASRSQAADILAELRRRKVLLSGLYESDRYPGGQATVATAQKPDGGDAWYIVVSGASAIDRGGDATSQLQLSVLRDMVAGRIHSAVADPSVVTRWLRSGHSRGNSGEIRTREQELQALREYREKFFALEHD